MGNSIQKSNYNTNLNGRKSQENGSEGWKDEVLQRQGAIGEGGAFFCVWKMGR